MPLPDGFRLRTADERDLPRIAELREQVGWSVHDWALRAALEAPHARCLVATEDGDRPIAVGSGVSYGALGIIGNMVVDEAHRRRGLGAAILEAAMAFLASRGSSRVELYATPDGRRLYRRFGFSPLGPSAMLRLPRFVASARDASLTISEAGPQGLDELTAYDAARFGGDRGAILAPMLADQRRPLVFARRRDALVGFAWIRPEAERIGPLVADTPNDAAALLASAFAIVTSVASLSLNLPAASMAGAERLRQLGAEVQAWDGRMARGSPVPRREDTIYANVLGALG
jgi:GNAT superfamily N-acetyltransferase